MNKKMLNKMLRVCVCILSIAGFGSNVYSQTKFLGKKVDQLSDAQVKVLIQQATNAGRSTDAQIAQFGVSQGLDVTETSTLTQRIHTIRTANGTSSFVEPRSNLFDSVSNHASANVRPKSNQLRIFGEDLFSSSGTITFEPNLRIATPQNYVIGPDDQILIDISGDNEANYNLRVSPEGSVNLQYVGIINIGGLTIEEARSRIKGVMSKTYSGLVSGKTKLAVNIGNIRSIKVTIVGEAVKPGSYTVSSLSTAFNVLYLSGGPNQNGSFRMIQLIRNGKVVSTIDIYDFLLNGIQKNLRLQDQDVLNIPVYKVRAAISGEVKRPAYYEILGKENLDDLINFAGSFSSEAYTSGVKVIQNTTRERRILDISSNHFNDYFPQNGDSVTVDKILNRFENRVSIEGAVFRPGKYAMEQGLTLKKLLAKADGLREDAFLNRGYINRLNADNTGSLLSFDVKRISNGTDPDILLQREDQVIISSIFDLRDEYTINIQGQVRSPGTFKYREGQDLGSIIQEAGGFKDGATPNRIEVARRIQNSNPMVKTSPAAQIFVVNVDEGLHLSGNQFRLEPFDIVSVRSAEGFQIQKTILIQGEVRFPGNYAVRNNNDKISDILRRAGGLTASAFPAGASLQRINKAGNSKNGRDIDTASFESEKQRNLRRLAMSQRERDSATLVNNNVDIYKSDFVGIDLTKIIKDSTSRDNLLVEDGDIIIIPRQYEIVSISGSVLRPINVIYKRGKSMNQYINESGGFTENANRHGAYIVYPNGSVRATKKFLFFYNYPSVKPGSEIFVPKRALKVPLGIQGLIGISTALASLAVIIITLFRK
ncbi:SLBB domain-containing protein [Mucilaginibacter ginkgonis]|uniref:SLBB domain-containing protein n=2 Tax=Mucilaginibacter ginkgonis TaxID=2682091 RepID=A0A6I4IMR4_9SPHI|nr:SLBB domain-containing protein [Mucilaginibacter ginkgonis]